MKNTKNPGKTNITMALRDYVDGRFYLVTGIYTALTALIYWNNNQLAERFERQHRETAAIMSQKFEVVNGRIDNLAGRIDNLAGKYDSQIEELRRTNAILDRRTDILYKRLGLE